MGERWHGNGKTRRSGRIERTQTEPISKREREKKKRERERERERE